MFCLSLFRITIAYYIMNRIILHLNINFHNIIFVDLHNLMRQTNALCVLNIYNWQNIKPNEHCELLKGHL